MGNIKQINRRYYFSNDMTNIKSFDSDLLKVDKKSYKSVDIYYLGYITIKNIGDYESIHSVNPWYFIIGEVGGYITEKNRNKYIIFASTYKHKELLTKYTELWEGINSLIGKINNKPGKYDEKYMQIKFNSDDSLPLNKLLRLHNLTIVIRFVFQEDNKYYPQVFLDECLYEF